ncbi:MAG: oligosaccharide flippase family protein [Clostridiales bacterium]|nr:oligosaccharide flippase family protein [Clostridiales bacterium]
MKTIVRSIFTLSVFSFIERLLGFIFKIYLSRELGATSLGIFQVAFSFFMVLLTMTTSGIPLIVSKRTAKCRAENDLCEEFTISSAALILGITASVIIIAVIILMRNVISGMFASSISMTLVLYMLPALLFSSVYSALRGNLWGRQKYTVVSVLELIEQISRIVACILLFVFGFDKILSTALSMSIACFISAAACAAVYFKSGGRLMRPKGEIKPLLKNSTPVTLSRASSSIIASLTSIAVPFILMGLGMTNDEAMYTYGYSVGMALPLMYIPLTFVGSMAFVMIPTLSRAIASKNDTSVKMQIERAISTAIVIGGIFVPTFAAIGGPIGEYVYNNADAGKFLAFSAWLMVPIAVENITSSMMNSLELEFKALINYIIGSASLFAFIFILGKKFTIEMLAVGMGISFTLSSALNIIAMRKITKFKLDFIFTIIKTAVLIIPSYFLVKWIYEILPIMQFFRIAICGIIGTLFITIGCFLFGTLKIEYFFNKKERRNNA